MNKKPSYACVLSLGCFLLLQGAVYLVDACAATKTCPDINTLMETADDSTFTSSSSGALPTGSIVSLYCIPETGDKAIKVTYDSGEVGLQDMLLEGGESLDVACQSNGKWATTAIRDVDDGEPGPYVVTKGYVSQPGSLLCENFASTGF